MPRLIRSMLTSVIIGVRRLPSPFALHFWQPLSACYGQAIGGDDEILFSTCDLPFSVPEVAARH